VSTEPAFTAEARAYLADCAAYPWLDRTYHPTEAGAVKLIGHRTSEEEDQIKAAFRSVAPAIAAPGPPDRAALIPLAIAGEDPDDIPA
jgi:hypothetical protein